MLPIKLLIAALVCSACASAQVYSFRTYGRAQGLANLTPQALLQDRAGYLWVGTQNGLFRYDGDRFEAFGAGQGLPSPGIEALHESADGTLWVGTSNGLARRSGRLFERVSITGAAREPIRLQGLQSAADGTLFVGLNQGLAVGKPGTFTLVSTGAARGLHVDGQGDLYYWCGTRVCRWRQGKVETLSPDLDTMLSRGGSTLTDRQGRLWARSSRGLFRYEQGRFVPAAQLPPADDCSGLALDEQGALLVPTDQGLAVQQGASFRLIGKRHGLPTAGVTAVWKDREGSIWLGLAGAGLARWIGAGEWEAFSGAEGPGNDNIWGIARDTGGALWVGTDLGVHWRDEHGWHNWPGLPRDRVNVVRAAADGAVWVGGGAKQLARLDRRTGTTRRYTADDGLEAQEIRQMAFGPGGRLWVATRRGMFVSSASAGAAARFTRMTIPGEPPEAVYEFVLADGGGRGVWTGNGRGLFHYDGTQWTRRSTDIGLLDDRVARLAQTPDGAVWLGYRSAWGLMRLAPPYAMVERFTVKNGLHSDQPISLGTDAHGRLWYATDDGVAVRDGETWRHYGQGDGLVWDDTNGNAFLAEPDGGVWFGTSLGLSHFQPKRPLRPAPVTPVLVSARLGDRELDPLEPLELAADAPALTLRYTALSFRHEAAVRFRVQLIGADPQARETSEREVRYAGLHAGSFQFQVQARAGGGAWSEPRVALAFGVRPPWWRSTAALLAAAFLLSAAWWQAWRLRARQLLLKQQELESAVAGRTAEIERLLREARQATRYKSEFLANMSHEIRTPMNGILGLTELTLQDAIEPAHRRNLEMVQSSSRALLAIINDILDLSKVEAGQIHLESIPFRLREQAEGVLELVSGAARQKGLALVVVIDAGVADTRQGDPYRLRQVLLNLVGNAVKFTERGSVTVRVSAGQQEDELVFAVRDTGIGIPASRLESIFDSFQQADGSITRRFGGTGLGLTIARQLAGLMGGRLWVESQSGEGSTFFLTARLPAIAEAPPVAAVLVAEAAVVQPLRVLLAEDNPVGQYLISTLLKRRGHQVSLAIDGEAAVDAALRGAFDVVLMDVQMPVLDGVEATGRIRAAGSGVRIIALTASALEGDRARCLAAGMDGFVSKPIEARDLIAAVEQATPAVRS